MFSISFINWILKTDFIFCQFWLPNKFFSFKNKKLFLKTENKEKNSYQTYYKSFLSSNFFIILQFFILPLFYLTKLYLRLTPSRKDLMCVLISMFFHSRSTLAREDRLRSEQ